ncbi:hypothetical protein ONS95_006839 [Cadophora gregata]|uniref:uncharacterized protein n=1 Tax=Cadophora gregata TaxID=51156 RepID=UPI0026DA7863|nr:uncharacterized protein ONS95_006839 [Cadophora gregata]KAK0101682.1 hypothetical protein ONS95_006839 [Cadophora gregata]KAK0106300.1 hypothetical protein ONS96_003939 [Cadophora gregata f. sp. sojae]
MAIDNNDQALIQSNNEGISFIFQTLRVLLGLQWKQSICVFTIFVICITILVQVILRLNERIQQLESEVQETLRTRKDVDMQIEALREEIEISREVDREEKLCLVETAKQIMKQRNVSVRGHDELDDVDTGSFERGSTIESDSIDWANEDQNDGIGRDSDDGASCPWCSHAHVLKLGDCAGDDNCDGSVHIPYCPSCFDDESVLHDPAHNTICSDGESSVIDETAS